MATAQNQCHGHLMDDSGQDALVKANCLAKRHATLWLAAHNVSRLDNSDNVQAKSDLLLFGILK